MPVLKENIVGNPGLEVVCWSCVEGDEDPKTIYKSEEKTFRTYLLAQLLANNHVWGFEDHVITIYVSELAN